MATATLSATPRNETGKGVARQLRRSGQTPGVIYGHAREPQPVAIDTRELQRLLDHVPVGSTVIELSLDGTTSRTLIREVQRHPFKRQILHVDFQQLVAGEKVHVSVPLVFTGTAEGVRAGGILDQVMHALEISVDPSSIPNHIDVDVTALTIGHSLHVGDIAVPEGVEVLDDEEATVCVVSALRVPVETPAEPQEAIVEPELIRKAKSDEDEE